jgi:hypothetical protein
LHTTLESDLSDSDTNFTYAQAGLEWLDADGNSIFAMNDSLDTEGEKSGKFTYVLSVLKGEAYTFSANTFASANISAASLPSAVPLPSAVWLFLSALIGVLGLNKRKSMLLA